MPWQALIKTFAIKPVQQVQYLKGKNASDFGLMLEALQLFYEDGCR